MREVGVNGARRVDGGRAVRNRPRPRLVRPGGEERDEPEETVGEVDDTLEGRLGQAQVSPEDGRLVRLQLADLHLDPRGQRLDLRVAVLVARRDTGGDL